MDPQTTPDVRLARIAASRYGVVSREQLRAIGFSDTMIRDRVAAGRLHRLYRGVYAVGHTVVNGDGRWLAAVLACGDGAVLSHRSAAAHWGIRPSAAARVDITVPRTSGVRSTSAIVVHRPTRASEVTTPRGHPGHHRRPDPRRPRDGPPPPGAGEGRRDGRVLRLDVRIPAGHPGETRLRDAMAHDLSTTTRSPLEDAFLELCDAHGIARPLVNTVVEATRSTSAGRSSG